MTPVPCRAVRLPLRLHPLVLALAALPLPLFAQEAAPAPSVNINEYIVRGNTVLDPRQIERAVEPFLGPGKTLADVEKESIPEAHASRLGGRYVTVGEIAENIGWKR